MAADAMTSETDALDLLHAAVRRLVPRAAVSTPPHPDHGQPGPADRPERCLTATHGNAGPLHVVWDPARGGFLWHSGPRAGECLGDTVGVAAIEVAEALTELNRPTTP
ncbi:hypothetical protein [Actinomadura litoris]|uniref:Uncharacterized protein n=1 Tax=Actinomadura litoris TaxID=2678616 RepID=A0A7K1LB12_9ACTN|nr:hypothetical protein [Actinomadura litoris]MUN41375.1 hypothetical protein [Actinomadura litoris]